MSRFRTITVAALIDLLGNEDADAEVVFSTDYGDYHHTPQALPLRGGVEEVTISESAYSNSEFQLDQSDDDDCEPDSDVERKTYLLIR